MTEGRRKNLRRRTAGSRKRMEQLKKAEGTPEERRIDRMFVKWRTLSCAGQRRFLERIGGWQTLEDLLGEHLSETQVRRSYVQEQNSGRADHHGPD